MKIKILGTGCAKCHSLEKTVKEVVKDLNIAAEIEEVKDMGKILEYPILATPGLVINGRVVSSGKVPDKTEVAAYINGALSEKDQ